VPFFNVYGFPANEAGVGWVWVIGESQTLSLEVGFVKNEELPQGRKPVIMRWTGCCNS
jgi:hypothetical protein